MHHVCVSLSTAPPFGFCAIFFLLCQTRWNSIVELVEQKKNQLNSMLRLQNYLLECVEIKSQIQDKRKAIDATQYMGSDLGGVMALQRRLSTMEGALSVLEPKLMHLQVNSLPEMNVLVQFSLKVGLYYAFEMLLWADVGRSRKSGNCPPQSGHGGSGAL